MLTDDFFLGTKLYQKQFIDLCKPITQYLGTTHAIYVNVDKQGKLFSICTHPNWVTRFLEEKYYLVDPLMVHSDNIHTGFSFDAAHEDQEFKDVLLYDAIVKFHWCNSFAYIEKNVHGGYFGFDFGTAQENTAVFNKLINGSQLVKKAMREIHKKIMLIVNDLEAKKMDFSALKGDAFYSQKGLVYNERQEIQNKIQILKEVGSLTGKNEQDYISQVSLSPQEINCLRAYIETHSLKKVSRDLDLAITTVSSYIENVKNKLSCNTKNELFERAEILDSLGRI